jgi:uncharacterized protein
VKDLLRYDKMVEAALRGVVREAIARAAANGLPGAHHFYVTFRTGAPGVTLPEYLTTQYPDEMTIVLEHQFWDLEVTENCFSVKLSFQNRPEQLIIPFEAITAFADPAVKFGLQFQNAAGEVEPMPIAAAAASAAAEDKGDKAEKPGEVVALDAFRKK